MQSRLTLILLITAICSVAGGIYAKPPVEKPAEAIDGVPRPKKKKAGEECKASDECQWHHRCKMVGEKRVCVAPEPHEIPPT